MIPLRVILKPAELGTTHGLAQLYLGWGGVGGQSGTAQLGSSYLCVLWSLGPLYSHL